MAEFQNLDLGKVLMTAEAIKGARRQSTMDRLQEQYMGQRIQQGEQEMAARQRAEQTVLGREKAEQVRAKTGFILQAPNPKNYIEQNEPELVKQLSANGVDWGSANDDQIRQIVSVMQQKASAELGEGPERPETFTLKPGETRYVGDKPVVSQPARGTDADGFTLSPGQTRYGPDGKPIASSAAAPDSTADNTNFARADKLRDEYNAASKDFIGVGDAYSRIIASAADPSAAGDLALIFSYMKILDPGSVVREQEFANAQNAAGVPDRVRAQYNKVLNGERLAGPQRADFIAQASNIYKSQANRHEKTVKGRYTKMATDLKLDPKYVVSDFGVDQPQQPGQQQGPVQIKSDADYNALPSNTQYIAPDGSTRTKR